MTQVLVNSEECTVQIKGDVIVFAHTSTTSDPIHLGARSVSQLLRSRKDETAAKLVADDTPFLLKFSSLHDRETFIDAIVRVQQAPPEPSNDDWVTSSICHAAVDAGMLDEAELKALMDADGQRGVEQAFQALEGLVDRDTFELLPITEQMENDVLRQIPILAAIFCDRVVDGETRRAFWEAVVRKYFCFSRTFLEEDIQRLEELKAPPLTTAAAGPGSSGLSSINASSLNALPKGAAVEMVDTDVNEEDLLVHLADAEGRGGEGGDDDDCGGLRAIFKARRSVRGAAAEVLCPVSGPSCPFPSLPASEGSRRPRFYGRHVLHQFPSESIEKSALEMLRGFWRSGGRQRKAVLAKYTSARQSRSSFIQRVCLEQAQRAVEEEK